MTKLGLLFLCMLKATAATEKPQGWLWYDPNRPQETSKEAPKAQKPKSPTQQLAALKKRFARAKARAVLMPTFTNVRRYYLMQTKMVDQSEAFQKMYQLVSSTEPQRLEDNPNPAYQKLRVKSEERSLASQLRALSKTHGLFFLYKAGCPYCHEFAPIVKRFARVYGLEVKAVSLEGQSIAEFPGAVKDNGAISVLNPEGIFPALLLANPKTGVVVPLSWGLSSWSSLHQNARVVLQALKGGSHA